MKLNHFQAQNGPLAQNDFFKKKKKKKNIKLIFMSLLTLFIMQNFKKILIQSYTMPHFQIIMAQSPQVIIFSGKSVNISSMCLLTLFLKQNFELILTVDPELRGRTHFWAQNDPIGPNENFFRKTVNFHVPV